MAVKHSFTPLPCTPRQPTSCGGGGGLTTFHVIKSDKSLCEAASLRQPFSSPFDPTHICSDPTRLVSPLCSRSSTAAAPAAAHDGVRSAGGAIHYTALVKRPTLITRSPACLLSLPGQGRHVPCPATPRPRWPRRRSAWGPAGRTPSRLSTSRRGSRPASAPASEMYFGRVRTRVDPTRSRDLIRRWRSEVRRAWR
jgi:hypothetical protein